jgi:P-type Cu2+ transporter
MVALAQSLCLHCGTAFAGGGDFCCGGCRTVYALLHEEGLERYYDLRGDDGVPVPDAAAERADRKWLDLVPAGGRVSLDVQGIRCAACVWLIEELFRRTPGGLEILLNPALGKLDLTVGPTFPLRAFVAKVEPFGYRIGPALKAATPGPGGGESTLIARMGVCVAIAMNSMIFGVAMYAGLRTGPVHQLFVALNFALSALSVVVGGSVFIRSAWHALQNRILHLDLPIALGILLAFGSSTAAFIAHRGDGAYFDTLNVFIALMLVGRFLQERVLLKNRRLLLASDGAEGLLTRRILAGQVSVVRCPEIATGDRLLLCPGDLAPVEAVLEDEHAQLSLDWISGEPAPRDFAHGDIVPAGAFNVGQSAVTVVARQDFADSALVALLRQTRAREADAARTTPWWRRLARVYVLAVLGAAAGAFAVWLFGGHDPGRALEVTAGVLIVTCPCAFGIATPLAYELAQAGLRRAGLYVRSAGFIDRAQDVRQVAFDKTGTLTTGGLRLVNPTALDGLAARERQALYDLVARSAHPKSLAVKHALEARGQRAIGDALVLEQPGRGVAMIAEGHAYAVRAGREQAADVVFSVDGRPRAALVTAEALRPDAAAEVRRLADDGYRIWILSGDDPRRVTALGADLGIPAERALGGLRPEAKGDWLAAHDAGDTLMVGDGLNDGPVVDRATCSGTPAVDRPFMPARSDFYFVTPGLRPIRLALLAARAVRRIVRRNLALAVAYNVVAVALAYAGLMSPLLAAVAMPASSLTVVLSTLYSLNPRSPLWRS